MDRRRRPKKKGGRCRDAAAPGQPLILRPQIGLGRIEALPGVGGVRMASRWNHRGRKGAFAPVCRCLRSERQRLGVVFSDFSIRPDGKLFCWSLFGPLVPGRPKKTRQRAGSWFVRCRGGANRAGGRVARPTDPGSGIAASSECGPSYTQSPALARPQVALSEAPHVHGATAGSAGDCFPYYRYTV